MNLNIEPIGVIKKFHAGSTDIIIYSDFEYILENIIKKFEKGTFLLIIHKSNQAHDNHQVQVSSAELIDWKGNVLRVKELKADNDSLIDVRLVTSSLYAEALELPASPTELAPNP